MRTALNPYFEALTVGTVAGMRSMSAPALVGLRHQNKRRPSVLGKAAKFLPIFAGLEMIADKLPFMPKRTSATALTGRVVMGALAVAAMLPRRRATRSKQLLGVALGAAAAVASSHLMFQLRKAATERLRVPNFIAGLVEDALVVGISKRLIPG